MGGVLPALAGAPALGAPIFTDGFEAGALLTASGGKWDSLFINDTSLNDLDDDTSAQRRGTYGMRMRDGNAASGGRAEAYLSRAVSTGPAAYYLRYWFRLTRSNASGPLVLSMLCSSPCSAGYGNVILYSDRTVVVEAETANGYVTVESNPPTQLSVGAWYLLEVAVTGLRSGNGRLRLWVNGQRLVNRTGIDFSNRSVGLLAIGQPWTGAGTFLGDLDFDDVYADDKPLPSHFGVEAPTNVAVAACVPVKVKLLDSLSNAPAPAPYAVSGVPLGLSGTATATLYSDAACTTASTTLDISADATEGTLYLKPSAVGSLTVTAGTAASDFLPGQQTLTVVAEPPPTSPNGTSCTLDAQCTSGFCVEGVCCDTACNGGGCDACSVTTGASVNGSCTMLPADTVCREPSGDCDVEERCTGSSALCPTDALAPSTLVCREETATHEATSCSGSTASCPAPSPKAPTQLDGGAAGGTPEPGGADGDLLCQEPDCIGQAEVTCSCATAGGPGLAVVLSALFLLLVRQRPASRRD